MALFARREAKRTWHGSPEMSRLTVPIDGLKEDPRNTRRHPEDNAAAIRRSLEQFGQRKPIVAKGRTVFAGSGTLAAARALGWTHVAVADADEMTEEQARAYGITDNQTALLSSWDSERLAEAFKAAPEGLLSATGFSPDEIQLYSSIGNEADHRSPLNVFHATLEQSKTIDSAIERATAATSAKTKGEALALIAREYLRSDE